MSQQKKPLFCRLNLHSWFIDSAFFTHAVCCNRCGKYKNSFDQHRLETERKLWDERTEPDFFKAAAIVQSGLLKIL